MQADPCVCANAPSLGSSGRLPPPPHVRFCFVFWCEGEPAWGGINPDAGTSPCPNRMGKQAFQTHFDGKYDFHKISIFDDDPILVLRKPWGGGGGGGGWHNKEHGIFSGPRGIFFCGEYHSGLRGTILPRGIIPGPSRRFFAAGNIFWLWGIFWGRRDYFYISFWRGIFCFRGYYLISAGNIFYLGKYSFSWSAVARFSYQLMCRCCI